MKDFTLKKEKRTEHGVDYGKRHTKETRQGCNNLPRQSIAMMEEARANLNYKPKLVGGHKMTTASNVLSNVGSFNCYYTNMKFVKKLPELNKIVLENDKKLARITETWASSNMCDNEFHIDGFSTCIEQTEVIQNMAEVF